MKRHSRARRGAAAARCSEWSRAATTTRARPRRRRTCARAWRASPPPSRTCRACSCGTRMPNQANTSVQRARATWSGVQAAAQDVQEADASALELRGQRPGERGPGPAVRLHARPDQAGPPAAARRRLHRVQRDVRRAGVLRRRDSSSRPGCSRSDRAANRCVSPGLDAPAPLSRVRPEPEPRFAGSGATSLATGGKRRESRGGSGTSRPSGVGGGSDEARDTGVAALAERPFNHRRMSRVAIVGAGSGSSVAYSARP